jgi:hypothetical protein
VQRHHVGAHGDGVLHRALHGVGNVVELEVEKEARIALLDELEHTRPFLREEHGTDLEPAHVLAEHCDQCACVVVCVDVERDDQSIGDVAHGSITKTQNEYRGQ